jgi:hypothetical protein
MEENMKLTNLNIINGITQEIGKTTVQYTVYTSSKSWTTENI